MLIDLSSDRSEAFGIGRGGVAGKNVSDMTYL